MRYIYAQEDTKVKVEVPTGSLILVFPRQEGGQLMRLISKILMFVAIMLAIPALILWVVSQLLIEE